MLKLFLFIFYFSLIISCPFLNLNKEKKENNKRNLKESSLGPPKCLKTPLKRTENFCLIYKEIRQEFYLIPIVISGGRGMKSGTSQFINFISLFYLFVSLFLILFIFLHFL